MNKYYYVQYFYVVINSEKMIVAIGWERGGMQSKKKKEEEIVLRLLFNLCNYIFWSKEEQKTMSGDWELEYNSKLHYC